MQVEYKVKLGKDEFLIRVEAASPVDFFEKLSFYSGLPKTGPGGEDDLKITHRTTTEGHNYYSLVSEKAGMEFKFGQPKKNPENLYGKGWEPLFKGEGEAPVKSKPAASPFQAASAAVPQPQTFAAPAPTPQIAFAPSATAQAPAAATPATTNLAPLANNVLARFGIPPKV